MSDRLPQDLHIDILVRLPVKSLLRFQCVSKSWKSLIRSTAFISTHTNQNESANNYAHFVIGHFFRTDIDNEIVVEHRLRQFDDSFREFQEIEFQSQIIDYKCFREVLACRGLPLLIDPYDCIETFILWNPAVRMSMTLPEPCIDVIYREGCVHGFGFDRRSNAYKVLRIGYGYYNGCLIFPPRAELFKLRTGVWKTVNVIVDFHYVIPKVAWPSQTFVNGASHWVGYHSRFHGYNNFKKLVVLLFDMSDEEFRVMKLPDVLTRGDFYSISLVVSGGLLSVIQKYISREHDDLSEPAGYNCSIWLMKEYGVIESWTKQCTIDIRDCGWLKEVVSFRNKRVLLLIVRGEKDELILYDPRTNRFINLGIGIESGCYLNDMIVTTYIENLVLLDQLNVIPEFQTSLRKRMRLT